MADVKDNRDTYLDVLQEGYYWGLYRRHSKASDVVLEPRNKLGTRDRQMQEDIAASVRRFIVDNPHLLSESSVDASLDQCTFVAEFVRRSSVNPKYVPLYENITAQVLMSLTGVCGLVAIELQQEYKQQQRGAA